MDGVRTLAFADLSSWRKIDVAGSDAVQWLNDLVSAEVTHLAAGATTPSLLLSPTGRVRAQFTVARLGPDTMLLVQDPDQPAAIQDLLERYVLSSDVSLVDRTNELHLMAFPDLDDMPNGSWNGTVLRPSVLGSGLDVLMTSPLTMATTTEVRRLSPEEVEVRRIACGIPKLGVDATEDDLPQEAGMTEAVSFDKGCFLGQEAVAKVRNLGHPRRVLLTLEADDGVSPGEALERDGAEVGRVTSAVRRGDGTLVLATVKWAARDGPFRTIEGAELRARPLPS